MKKGEIAISVIIVIALGLIVLITLAVMLVSSTGDAQRVTDACEDTYGGTCMAKSRCTSSGGGIIGGVSCSADLTNEFDNGWAVESFPIGGGACCVN
jgi:hypothetical protein